MAAKDSDIFIPIGTSIVRLLFIASGQETLATAVGEGAGLLAKLRGALVIGGKRAVFAEKIADDAADRLLREFQGISKADWGVAARQVASLIDRLPEKERLAAGYSWEELRQTLLDQGGTGLRRELADESAKQAFNWVLEVACQRIADYFTEKEALASILERVDEVSTGVQRLLDRPPGASQTDDVVKYHIKIVRDLAPDPLEDREQEIAELETFVRGSEDAWYALEASMVSGKTALMSSFALNPPDDVHVVSFFARRISGDGNDRGRFALVMGAQLANILGHEYTEEVSEGRRPEEFDKLLRQAATACRSNAVPQTLVLVIDGIDEDSYFERRDGLNAKSILSLLPQHLPEGVKVITASRPNPRLPEDVICDAPRSVYFLKPSPIAQGKINRKDIETFFDADFAVDIGAFLASCGGSLTIGELRQLVSKHRNLHNVPTRDIKVCVGRSPGRMLMSVNVGFGNKEITAYSLGHDAVLRAVIREVAPEYFGEDNDPEDQRWWAQTREKALAPYCDEIRQWVKECVDRGWGYSTPSYVLSESCFDLMLVGEKDVLLAAQTVLHRGRYEEMKRRSDVKSYVLRMIDRECYKVLDMNRGNVSEGVLASLLEVGELRERIARTVIYIPGSLRLYVLNFDFPPEVVQDMVLSIDEPKSRLEALREVLKAAVESGYGHTYLSLLPVVLKSLRNYADLSDKVLRLLVDILVCIYGEMGGRQVDGSEVVFFRGWFPEVFSCVNVDGGSSRLLCSLENANALGDGCYSLSILHIAEDVAMQMEGAWVRVWALAKVLGPLVQAGEVAEVRRVVARALSAADQIKDPQKCVQALVGVAGVLAQVDEVAEVRRVVARALSAADQIKDPQKCVQALVGVAGVLAQVDEVAEVRRVVARALSAADQIKDPQRRARSLARISDSLVGMRQVEEAIDVANQVKDPEWHSRALVGVVGVLDQMGEVAEARRIAESALKRADQIKDYQGRVQVLVAMANVLAQVGQSDSARQVAESLLSATDKIKSIKDRTWVLVKVVDVLISTGQINEAIGVAERVKDHRRGAQALVRVANALAWAGETSRARQVVDSAVGATAQNKGSWGTSEVLIMVVSALVREGEINKAWLVAESAVGVADQVRNYRQRTRVLMEVAGVFARAGETNKSLRVAESAVDAAGQIKDRQECVQILVDVVGVLVQMGEVAESRQVAEIALSTANRLKVPQRRAQALVRVSGVFGQIGEVDESRRVVESALSIAGQIEDIRGRTWALIGLVRGLTQVGEVAESRRVVESALGMAGQIEDVRGRVQALVGVAGVLTQVGEVGESRRVVESALGMAGQIEDVRGRVQALVGVAGVLTQVGEVGESRRVVETALSASDHINDVRKRTWALVEVVFMLVRVGKIDWAIEVVERVKDPEGRMQALVRIVSALAWAGEVDKIRRIAEDATCAAVRAAKPGARERALVSVAKALVQVGLIDESQRVADIIADPYSRSCAQSGIIMALVRKGSLDEAVSTLRLAMEEVEGIARRQDAANCCSRLAAACIEVADSLVDSADVGSAEGDRWFGLARSLLARSWLYGASVWDRFGILMRVAPDLAMRLVDERLLADPKSGTASASEPAPGPEGPGGDAGAYR